MSYLPIPRCISIPCNNNENDLSYFIMLQMAQIDYQFFQTYNDLGSAFVTLSLENGVLEYGYDLEYTFTDPNDPSSGGAIDVLLPCCPTNGPEATNFTMNYYNSETNSYPPGSVMQCAIEKSGGTINPPTVRPKRDLGEAIGNGLPFILQSVTDPTNQGLGIVVNIPANINPRLVLGTQDADPSVLSLAALDFPNSDAYDVAIFNIQPYGNYTSFYITFPDGSVTDTVSTAGAQVFII